MSRPLIHRIYDVVLPLFRKGRMEKLDRLIFGHANVENVIDLGGAPAIWSLLPHEPAVTLLNIEALAPVDDQRFRTMQGDATAVDFGDDSFDLVFSNSVIEHVGEDRWAAFAAECQRLAPAVFVQTPARAFPFEPHLLTPLVHYLPKRILRRIARNFTVWGLLQRPTQAQVDAFVSSTTLLTHGDMVRLFPDCEILTERFLGVPKSYIAYRLRPSDAR